MLFLLFPDSLGKQDHLGNNTSNHTRIDPCTQKTSTKNFILAVFSASVLAIGILGNVLSIALIQGSSRLRTHIHYIFVTSLAFADLGVSVFVTTIKVGYYMDNSGFCHGYTFCVLFHLTDSFFPIVSITNLAIIGAVRCYAVLRPYDFLANMTKYRAKCITVGVWTYSMLWSMLGFFSWEDVSQIAFQLKEVGKHRYCYSLNKYYHTTLVSVIYIIPMAITAFLYVTVVYSVMMKRPESIRRCSQKVRKRRRLTDIKTVKTVVVVFLAFTVCWLPHIVLVIIHYWFPYLLYQFYIRNLPLYDVTTTIISNILPTLNSCINPFLYFIMSNEFRRAVNDVVFRCRKKTDENSEHEIERRMTCRRIIPNVNGSAADNRNYGSYCGRNEYLTNGSLLCTERRLEYRDIGVSYGETHKNLLDTEYRTTSV